MMTSEQRHPHRDDGGDTTPWPPQWMLDLERAHDRLGRAAHLLESGAQSGPVDLRPPARALERVFAGIFDAFEERRPRYDAARDAVAALDEAVELLSPAAHGDAAVGFALDYLREVRGALVRAGERVASLVPRPLPPSPELRASFERPTLHAIDRPSLTPHLRVPTPKPLEVEILPPRFERPKTFEELERVTKQMKEMALAPKPPRTRAVKPPPPPRPEPPPGFALDVRPALSEARFLQERVRGCFEEMTMIGVQRAPLLGDPWRTSRVLERRMLASIDAIVALGPPALETLEALVFDSPLKDPSRVFATAMILGCVTGRDTLAMAERVFAAFELDDPQHAAQLGAALKLVPHPYLPLSLRTFLSDPDSARRALAVDVLAYRGMATPEELLRAATDEPDVAAAALPWLSLTRHPGVRAAIDAAIDGPVGRLRAAARLAMVLSADARAVTSLRGALSGEPEEAAAAVALLGVVAGLAEAELLIQKRRGGTDARLGRRRGVGRVEGGAPGVDGAPAAQGRAGGPGRGVRPGSHHQRGALRGRHRRGRRDHGAGRAGAGSGGQAGSARARGERSARPARRALDRHPATTVDRRAALGGLVERERRRARRQGAPSSRLSLHPVPSPGWSWIAGLARRASAACCTGSSSPGRASTCASTPTTSSPCRRTPFSPGSRWRATPPATPGAGTWPAAAGRSSESPLAQKSGGRLATVGVRPQRGHALAGVAAHRGERQGMRSEAVAPGRRGDGHVKRQRGGPHAPELVRVGVHPLRWTEKALRADEHGLPLDLAMHLRRQIGEHPAGSQLVGLHPRRRRLHRHRDPVRLGRRLVVVGPRFLEAGTHRMQPRARRELALSREPGRGQRRRRPPIRPG